MSQSRTKRKTVQLIEFQITSTDVYSYSTFMHISQVKLTTTVSVNVTYTIHYSELSCSESAGNMKVISYNGAAKVSHKPILGEALFEYVTC